MSSTLATVIHAQRCGVTQNAEETRSMRGRHIWRWRGSCQALNQGSSDHRASHGTQEPAVTDPDAHVTEPGSSRAVFSATSAFLLLIRDSFGLRPRMSRCRDARAGAHIAGWTVFPWMSCRPVMWKIFYHYAICGFAFRWKEPSINLSPSTEWNVSKARARSLEEKRLVFSNEKRKDKQSELI